MVSHSTCLVNIELQPDRPKQVITPKEATMTRIFFIFGIFYLSIFLLMMQLIKGPINQCVYSTFVSKRINAKYAPVFTELKFE
jgi:hypothetical protein